MSALWATVSSPCLFSLTLGWMSSRLRCLRCQLAAKFAVSAALRGSSSFSCLCLSFTCSWVRVVWSQVCDPTCSSWVLGSSGVSVALFCRISLWPHPLLLFSRRGFLPWAFVRTWVGRLRSCLGSYLLLGELSFPYPGFSLGGSCRLVVQTPGIFLESLLGFFPLASNVCCGLEVVQVNPWLSTLRSLAVEVVTLVLCQLLVGLPSWGCSASGFLGPVVFLVFPFVRGPLP